MPPLPPLPPWRAAAWGAALVAYAIGGHALMQHAADRPWSLAVLIGPLWAAVMAGAWRRRHRPTLATGALVAAALLLAVALGGVQDFSSLYVLQHAGIHVALAWTFAITLRPGQEPLISALAARVHGPLAAQPALAAYTRRLTGIWAAYFVGMIALSLALYAWTPWPWWSLFGNVLTPLAAITLFVGEYVYRRARHPEFGRVPLSHMVQAWRGRAEASTRAAR